MVVLVVILLLEIASGEDMEAATKAEPNPVFGVDVSFPMQHAQVTQSQKPLGDSVMDFYFNYLQGCRNYYKERAGLCDESELSRLNLNLQQPAVMQNYTSAGYAKVQLPANVMKLLESFWENNEGSEYVEKWPAGNTYVNHWETPTYMLPLGTDIRKSLLDAVQPTLEAWTGQSLVFTSLYGVRVYKEGAVLSPHIDRLPLVTSAIINVAQDVDEPWPLEVIGHDGKATNVTVEPGEMVLYESHSVIHGKPCCCSRHFWH
jgi:prolyl 4-hydroxylase